MGPSINKSSPEDQLVLPTARSPLGQIRQLGREVADLFAKDIRLPYAESTRFRDRSFTCAEAVSILRESLGLPPYRLDLRAPRFGDREGWKVFDYLMHVHCSWPRLFAEPNTWAQPMHEQCKLSISVPVAAHNEQLHVYRTIREYAQQTASPDDFELCLFINLPRVREDRSPVVPDRTVDEVNRAMRDFPELRVRWRYVAYDKPAPIGTIRLHADASILFRHWGRCAESRDHLILRADADSTRVSPRLVATYLREASKFPRVDMFRGPIEYDPAALGSSAGYLLTAWIDQYFHAYYRATPMKSLFLGGANTMYRAKAYVRAGGYQPHETFAEDRSLGLRIVFGSVGSKEEKFRHTGAATKIVTSARRSVCTSEIGYPASFAWSNKENEFKIDDGRVRSWEPGPFAEDRFERELSDPDFAYRMSGLLSHAVRGYTGYDHQKFRSLVSDVLVEHLGLPLFVDEKTVTLIVRDAEALKERLRLWRKVAIERAEAARRWSSEGAQDLCPAVKPPEG